MSKAPKPRPCPICKQALDPKLAVSAARRLAKYVIRERLLEERERLLMERLRAATRDFRALRKEQEAKEL